MMTKQHVGVELMTYGSPATLDDIPVYIKHVYGGREPSPVMILSVALLSYALRRSRRQPLRPS
jgi:protoheme ferro-lyase